MIRRIAARVSLTGDLARRVDGERSAEGPTQAAEVSHAPVLVQEGVRGPATRGSNADDLPRAIDAIGVTVLPAQRAEVGHGAVLV
jgi:hypothetical protein